MLLVTDLDGTLLTSQKTISPRTRQALVEFHQRGGLLAACSARPVSSMMRLLQQQQVNALFGWCAGFNGGQILEMAQQRNIHTAALSCMNLRDIDRHIALSLCPHHFFSADAIYHRCDLQVAPWTTYEARLFELPLYIDIQRSEINKGYAISMLMHQLNITADKVAAIGDQQNDISMFSATGIGIAMGNAPEVVKRQASYVTASNDDEGIVCALEWLRCSAHPVTMRQSTTLAENNEPD
ncbi:Cof-type HAD-IIB family hydrolase [Citrobacter sp. Colony322]|uniref:Cof-type HAD-IIB family hydrolase n=1 Tax=Citrobacter sp. Colony322 TaxID=2861801 RepID=UPI001C5F4DD6|nr:Cof-type HAD-IIB family hydrolase [Citrobacter sp. Colony322]